MVEDLTDFEKKCLEFIVYKNEQFKSDLICFFDSLIVVGRFFDNPAGLYIDFEVKKDQCIRNIKIPEILFADLEFPEFGDCTSFVFYNQPVEYKRIFIEITPMPIPIYNNFDYIKLKIESIVGMNS